MACLLAWVAVLALPVRAATAEPRHEAVLHGTTIGRGPGSPKLFRLGIAVAVLGNTAIAGAPDTGNLSSGAVVVFVRSRGIWHRQATIFDPGAVFGASFGFCVALSRTATGLIAAIGATGVNNGHGGVYLFGRSGNKWRRLAELADPDPVPGGDFGCALAMSGSSIIVGENAGRRVSVLCMCSPNPGVAGVNRRNYVIPLALKMEILAHQ
jgi:hypothetical protein